MFPQAHSGRHCRPPVNPPFAAPNSGEGTARRRGARWYRILVGRPKSADERLIHPCPRSLDFVLPARQLQPGILPRPSTGAAFPAEVTKVLAASLDYSTTLDTLARLAVSHLADWCLVDVVETDGLLYRAAVAHVDPWQQSLVERLREVNAVDREAGGIVLDVLSSGQAALLNDVTESLLVANARGSQHLETLRALDPQSLMVVPLRARGRILGALTLASSDPARRYDCRSPSRSNQAS